MNPVTIGLKRLLLHIRPPAVGPGFPKITCI